MHNDGASLWEFGIYVTFFSFFYHAQRKAASSKYILCRRKKKLKVKTDVGDYVR